MKIIFIVGLIAILVIISVTAYWFANKYVLENETVEFSSGQK